MMALMTICDPSTRFGPYPSVIRQRSPSSFPRLPRQRVHIFSTDRDDMTTSTNRRPIGSTPGSSPLDSLPAVIRNHRSHSLIDRTPRSVEQKASHHPASSTTTAALYMTRSSQLSLSGPASSSTSSSASPTLYSTLRRTQPRRSIPEEGNHEHHHQLRHSNLSRHNLYDFGDDDDDEHHHQNPCAKVSLSSNASVHDSPSHSSLLQQRRGSVTRPGPYDRPLLAAHTASSNRDMSHQHHQPESLEGVEQLSLGSPPRSSESEDNCDRRKGPKTPPDCCAVCGATETAEWRRGPAGSRMLCNGCGLCAAKRAKERASEGFPPFAGDVEIYHELKAIGAERFKTLAEEYVLPDGAMERIKATRERTQQMSQASVASSQRMQKTRRRVQSRSRTAIPPSPEKQNPEAENLAAASLIGLRRASIGGETSPTLPPIQPHQVNPTSQLLARHSARFTLQSSTRHHHHQTQQEIPMRSSTTVPGVYPRSKTISSHGFSPLASRPVSHHSVQSDELPPLNAFDRHKPHQPQPHHHQLPSISKLIPAHHYQVSAIPAVQPIPSLLRRRSLVDTWRERTNGAPLPSIKPPTPPLKVPSSSVRSTMMGGRCSPAPDTLHF